MMSNSEGEDPKAHMDGSDFDDAAGKAPKKAKSPKNGKGEKKKNKSWKIESAEEKKDNEEEKQEKTQQPTAEGLSGAENGLLKLNVNPTEREETVDDPEKKDGTVSKTSVERQDKEREKGAGSALSQTSKKTGRSSKLKPVAAAAPIAPPSNRQMDRMFLNRETRELKENLLDQVDKIVTRQNGLDPMANFESFISENSARKVLKELLSEFQQTAEELRKKQSANEEKIKAQKALGEKQQVLMKKLQTQCSSVESFNKRMQVAEQKLDSMKDSAEKRHEAIREFVNRVKDMLEARVDQVTQFQEKITSMNDEVQKIKGTSQEFMERIMADVMRSNELVQKVEDDLKVYKQQQQYVADRFDRDNDEKAEQIKNMNLMIQQLKVDTKGKLDQQDFSLSRYCKLDDMSQNFKRLNDILVVKFKQLEDTKQACRNIITYQKFFYPVATQQLISKNLMGLKAAKTDQGFIMFQQQIYQDTIDKTKEVLKASQKISDIDLSQHRQQLGARNLLQGDWGVFPLTQVSEGADFVSDLLERYLQDLRVRQKEDAFGDLPSSIIMRKTVKLSEIDDIIDKLEKNTISLKSESEAYAEKLAEEAKAKEIQDNIRRLTKRKLDYRHRQTYKRNMSFKGRNRGGLFDIDQKDGFKEKLQKKKPRAPSREAERKGILRPVQREKNIGFDDGAIHKASESMMSQQSELGGDAEEKEVHTPADPGALQVGGAGISDVGQMMQMAGGAPGVGGPMSVQDKVQFVGEIKVELRPLITEIAQQVADATTAVHKKKTDSYEASNERDKKNIVFKVESELLRVSEHLKKQLKQMNGDIEDSITQLQKQRAREKADNVQTFERHSDSIMESKSDLHKHNSYFDVLAQTIALMAENINMQMEAEYADLFDRKLISLYGAQPGKASLVDVNTDLDSKVRQGYRSHKRVTRSPKVDTQSNTVSYSRIRRGDDEDEASENAGSIDQYVDHPISKFESLRSVQRIATNEGNIEPHDNIRMTSGVPPQRKDMVITIDQKCMSHQSKQDTELTLKLFKIACLAYKPTQIQYRGNIVERTHMIEMRRNMIDRVSALLPSCDLFKGNAIFPKRYFDDLMIEEKGYLEHIQGQQSRADFKLNQYSKLSNLLGGGNSSTNVGSEAAVRNRLAHSPTHQMPLNQHSSGGNLTLPELNPNIASKLAFGIGQKGNYDAISDVQQFGAGALMNRNDSRAQRQGITLDIAHDQDPGLFGYTAKSQLKGMYSSKNREKLNQTDLIKRTASVAVVNGNHAPKLFGSSRKNFTNLDQMNSTIEKDSQRDKVTPHGGITGPKMFVEGVARSPNGEDQHKTFDFHKRNNSTFGGQNYSSGSKGLKIEMAASASKVLGTHRPSAALPAGVQLFNKPKVSFDLPNIGR